MLSRTEVLKGINSLYDEIIKLREEIGGTMERSDCKDEFGCLRGCRCHFDSKEPQCILCGDYDKCYAIDKNLKGYVGHGKICENAANVAYEEEKRRREEFPVNGKMVGDALRNMEKWSARIIELGECNIVMQKRYNVDKILKYLKEKSCAYGRYAQVDIVFINDAIDVLEAIKYDKFYKFVFDDSNEEIYQKESDKNE